MSVSIVAHRYRYDGLALLVPDAPILAMKHLPDGLPPMVARGIAQQKNVRSPPRVTFRSRYRAGAYVLHSRGDSKRELILTVLVFHVPK